MDPEWLFSPDANTAAHQLKKRALLFKSIDFLSGHGASQNRYRYPPLQEVQPAQADDAAPEGAREC